jgi:hypothetical protein
MNDDSTITPESMPLIAYKGRPVVTTEMLAKLYGTDSHNIIKNYRGNTDRFVDGTHYFKLEGQELREFKHSITQSDSVKIPRNVNALLIWTERGAARHAKMLDTEQAWEVFEKLEDCYFNGGKNLPPSSTYGLRELPRIHIPLTPGEVAQLRERVANVARYFPLHSHSAKAAAIYAPLHMLFGVSRLEHISASDLPTALVVLQRMQNDAYAYYLEAYRKEEAVMNALYACAGLPVPPNHVGQIDLLEVA